MPALVAHHHLHAVLVIREQRTVGTTVADRDDLPIGDEVLDVAEAFGKRGLRMRREVLAREDQYGVLEECRADGLPLCWIERVEIDAGDDGAEGCRRAFDSRVHDRLPRCCARRSL